MGRYESVLLPQAPRGECPAAEFIGEVAGGGSGCRCRIEGSVITAREDPSTLGFLCFNEPGYQECPTWRADKEHVWATGSNRDLLTADGELRVPDQLDRDKLRTQRLQQAEAEQKERRAWEAAS